MTLIDWIIENRQWFLSGMGVALAGLLFRWLASVGILTIVIKTIRSPHRFLLLPIKKLCFPISDQVTGVKQSRMRYYRVLFRYRSGDRPIAYQEIDSNGNLMRYVNLDGFEFIPDVIHEAYVVGRKEFQFPEWRRIDWSDVFSGIAASGTWGITAR